jgi:hypothetical protein
MKRIAGILLVAFFVVFLSACHQNKIEKPEQLIPKAKFVKILTDIYLYKNMNNQPNIREKFKDLSQTDMYYSVLKKYGIPDSVFIRSLIYYSSFPKELDKMHSEILTKLQEEEQKFQKKEELNVEGK